MGGKEIRVRKVLESKGASDQSVQDRGKQNAPAPKNPSLRGGEERLSTTSSKD